MKSISAILVMIFVALLGGAAWFYISFVNQAPSASSQEVIFEVKPGKPFKKITRELKEQGLIRGTWQFSFLAHLRGATHKLRVGEYLLRPNMRPDEVLQVITSGKSIPHPFTVQEGFNIYEVADLWQSKGFGKKEEFLKLCHDQKLIKELLGEPLPSLEGYLFPETYNLTKYTGAEGLIRMMVSRFLAVYAQLKDLNKTGLGRNEIVTLASIIEKETGAPDERPRISSVFHNRLKIKMKLQTDPTVLYGIMDKTGSWRMNITRQDLIIPTRYNTYVLPGLPFGPIANPGRESLRSAMQPDTTNYLYFVSRNDGTHVFTTNFKDHNAAVRKYQLDPKAREGKSWRDLKKARQ